MTTSYGAGTSRHIDPSGRNWDTIVIQQFKPGFDGEQNLQQDLRGEQNLLRARASCPSGWLTGDFWEAEPYGPSSWLFGTTANTFGLVGRPLAVVNGWAFPVEFTGSAASGVNLITLPSPSASIGAVDADFVFLEVWRALVLADPSTVNKPSATEVFPNGNILADAATFLPDDLLNPTSGPLTEGAGRVQVQYAIRSVRLASRATRLGYDDAAVLAQGPAVVPTAYAYAPVAGDPGLWRAGTGVPADTGTVDGYVYSIPVAIVFRRNLYQTGGRYWDYLSNGNGGVPLSAGTSDRPDGLFGDQVAACDLLDLRHAVSLTGSPDYARIGEFSWSLLQDLTLRPWALDAAFTGWTAAGDNAGNLYFKADDFIPSVPGTDLASGNTIRSLDGVCSVFSDRPVLSRYLIRQAAPMGGWVGGEVLTLDFTTLISPLGAPLADEMPLGTVIRDLVRVVQDDTAGSGGQQEWTPASVGGLGTLSVTITLDASPPVPASLREIWAELLVEYPAGGGMTSHVTEPPANFAMEVHAPSNLGPAIGSAFTDDPVGRAAIRAFLQAEYEAGPHRELALTLTTSTPAIISVVSASALTVVLPEPVLGGLPGVLILEDSAAASHVVAAVDATGRVITLDAGDPLPAPDDLVTVTYQPRRPLPVTASPVTVYYRSAALQAINAEYLPAVLEVSPVWASSGATIMTASSGSPITPYPYEAPSTQLPVHAQQAAWTGEDNLLSPGEVSIADFSVNAGMIQAAVMIPPVMGAAWSFNNPVNIGAQDAEFIDHYQSSPVLEYKPSTAAQGLSAIQRHKTAFPVLAILRQDTLWAREGELVLVVLTEYHPLDKINRVAMSDDVLNAAGAAAIYRVKGGWLTPVPQ